MQHVLRCWERQSDGSEFTRKPLGGRGSVPDPAECLQRSRKPPGGGAGCLISKNPIPPLSALQASLLLPTPKLVQTPLVNTKYQCQVCMQLETSIGRSSVPDLQSGKLHGFLPVFIAIVGSKFAVHSLPKYFILLRAFQASVIHRQRNDILDQ